MILEGLLNIIFSLLIELFEVLPNISWSTDDSAMGTFFGFISVIMYLLPMHTIIQLLGLVISLLAFKAIIAIIKTLWDLLPFI